VAEQIKVIGAPGQYETLLDTLANYLGNKPVFAQQPDTSVVHWVLGDIGMGPTPGLPVGFISPLNDALIPYGRGGSTGGPHGTDMDDYTVPMLIIQAEHKAQEPVPTKQAGASEYLESPGYRELMQLVQKVRAALRIEPTFGGAVATSTITELRPMLIDLDTKVYRGARLTLVARQRRSRG
jgi:hypothetical protein